VLDDTRNQPVVTLPCFDHGQVFIVSSRARRSHGPPGGVSCLSATDGALIGRRRAEIEGFSSGAGAVVRFRGSRGLAV
jgi:hypothetical protein